ncbi:serine protease [Micromonospora sp. WMMD1120]|uniref:trypsin-like serine peptidase n=1 Tax=Micromonospora sp. WMMD1120 TaxID=3016106 RepID=UPI002415BB1E|nr:serine protease [Micromonospora sp. WMMD1120]MDG4809390.1 serine protease [Micromonospora sp. WMMD1120]
MRDMLRRRVRDAAVVLGVWVLGASLVPAPAAGAEPAPPTAPASVRAPEVAQFSAEGVTTVGELRVLDATRAAVQSGSPQVIRHPGATYIKVHFRSLRLDEGDHVTVSSPDGQETYRYDRNLHRAAGSDYTTDGEPGFWAMSVTGDTAVVTLHSRRPARAIVDVDRFWRGYDQAEIAEHNFSTTSVCSTDARRDVVCYQNSHPTEYARGRAVARLLIGGGGLCTTWRVGDTNRMLTNKHCVSTQSTVSASEVQFNYQCATCGGGNPGSGTKVSGATLYRVSSGGSGELDYALYSVNNFSTIQGFGTLYLRTTATSTGTRIYIPGHGDGSPKRLSIYEDTQNGGLCTVRNANYNTWNISYSCDTSGGNSGSPVLDAAHRVVALHHLGGCPSNQGAKAHLIYNEIASLIDNG